MATREEELLKRLLETFQLEAQEHIQALASDLVELERPSGGSVRAELLDTIFRHAHSLKGAARAVNVMEIETVCQAVESLFAAMKHQKLAPSPGLFDLLHKAVDLLGELLVLTGSGTTAQAKPRVNSLIQELHDALSGESTLGPATSASPAPGPALVGVEEKRSGGIETVRVSTAKLDAVLLQAEELFFAKQASARQAARLRLASTLPVEWEKRWNRLRPDLRLVQKALESTEEEGGHLARIAEFLEWNRLFVEDLENKLDEFADDAERNRRAVGTMVDNLADEMKKVVMQPFSTLTAVLPRMVRELARDRQKDVNLSLYGGEIEVDRRILEEMKDPLIHLIRNGIDHGIELASERTNRGKAACGTITVGISAKSGGHFELLIADDGAGIDTGKLKAAAKKANPAATQEIDALGDKDALSLALQSGISTSQIITDISGRGLGLAIVKEKVERLNSTLSVESEPGRGTTFRIVLPLTLARFQGVVLRIDEAFFVAPVSQVERVTRVKRDSVKTVENRETVSLDGATVSLVRLRDALQIGKKGRSTSEPDVLPIVVLATGEQRIAFIVDEVLREQEVLIKSLGANSGESATSRARLCWRTAN